MYLGAFGKHPGWNDHIDDLGLETQRLVDLKTVMYVEGISACVDSGRWDKLEPDAQIDGFGHVVLLRIRGDIIIARLWSSSDGKGRTKYPMVVAAQVSGVTLDWALNAVLPELESVQERCQNARTAAEVVAIVDTSRQSLRAALTPGGTPDGAETVIPAGLLDELSRHPAFGPDAQGLHRVLYQIGREAGDYLLGAQPTSRIGRPDQSVTHLRVPQLSADPSRRAGVKDDFLAYARLLLCKLEPWAPTLLIAPLGKPFVDVLIGEPSGGPLYCLRAAEKAIPLTTEIPYSLDAAFVSDLAAWRASRRGMGDVTVNFPPPSVLKKSAGTSGRFRSPVHLWSCAGFAGLALGVGGPVQPVSAAAQSASQPAPATQPSGAAPASGSGADQPAYEEPRRRYNESLRQLASDLVGVDDARARALVENFAQSVGALPGGIAFLAEVESTIARLRAALDGAAAPASDAATKLGPGATGQYVGQRDGELLRFVPVSGASLPELVFAPVQPASPAAPGGRGDTLTYVGRHEVSVMVARRLAALAPAGELAKALTTFDAMTDPRRGPRSWEWNRAQDAIIPARAWWPDAPGAEALPAGAGVPTDEAPMQYLSPSAAAYLAHLVGCRLPTSAEWSAALGRSRHDDGACNLQDRSFDAFAQRYRVGPDDLDAFPVNRNPEEPPREARITDDAVWFWGVGKGCGSPFKNLIGNVSEYVLDPAPDTPGSPSATSSRFSTVDEWVRTKGNAVWVVGPSALTGTSAVAAEADRKSPVEVVLAAEGYSDVGFRLAFSVKADRVETAAVEGGSTAARVRRVLEPLPTLPVR